MQGLRINNLFFANVSVDIARRANYREDDCCCRLPLSVMGRLSDFGFSVLAMLHNSKKKSYLKFPALLKREL